MEEYNRIANVRHVRFDDASTVASAGTPSASVLPPLSSSTAASVPAGSPARVSPTMEKAPAITTDAVVDLTDVVAATTL